MKKNILILIFAWLLTGTAWAQCANRLVYNPALHSDLSSIMLLDIKNDFCAVGDGVTNDSAAFRAASNFINKRRGYCKLTIPAGTYIVGEQHPTDTRYLSTHNVIRIDSARHVEIAGVGNPTIKFEGGGKLKYGYFNPDGTPKMFNTEIDPLFNSSPFAADLGSMVYVYNSKNVKISGLFMDGNLNPGEMVIGGYDLGNFNGIQEDYNGIAIWYSDSVKVSDVTARRMGLDGFYIYNGREDGGIHKEVLFENCVSDFSGRQGISIIGGQNITVNNSQFTNVGMGEITFSGLQAGVDIETNFAPHIIKNITFNNCTFSKCRNAGVVITAGPGPTSEIYFNNCIIDNLSETGNNTAISLGRHKKVKFTDCKIYGYVTIDASNATSYDDGYSFKRCLFSDCSHKTVTWTTPGNPPTEHCAQVRKPMVLTSSILIYSFSSWDYVSMDSCTFDVYTKRPWYFANATPGIPSEVSNSTIYVNGQSGIDFPTSSAGDTVLQSRGLNLSNNKFYMHSTQQYLNGSTVISGTTPLTTPTLWFGNTFYRWNSSLPPRVCADTLPCPSSWSATATPLQKITSGVDAQVTASPNPTDGSFRLSLSETPVDAMVLILSTDGRIILNQKLSSRYTDLDISTVPTGIYILRITTPNGITTKKLTKQ